jgi:hypothetical protein
LIKPEAEFLDKIQTKVLGAFLLAILVPCRLYSFALRFIFLFFFKITQPLTVSNVQLLYTVNEKGGKPDRNHTPLPYGLRNPYRYLKSEKLQRNCTFMNSASGQFVARTKVRWSKGWDPSLDFSQLVNFGASRNVSRECERLKVVCIWVVLTAREESE